MGECCDVDGRVPPVLVGLAVDVSGSMAEAIGNPAGPEVNRLAAVRDLARRGREVAGDVESAARVFAFGFGFGFGFAFGNPISVIMGRSGPPVRDLLALPGRDGTVSVVDLADRWDVYEEHLRALGVDMLGSTPMLEGLIAVRDRFADELRRREHCTPVLFLLSDGMPDSGTAPEVLRLVEGLRRDVVLVVSCYGKEMGRALERHGEGTAVVVPVLLRPVDWEDAPFRHLTALPTDARPVTSWPSADDGFADVARGIRASVVSIRAR